MIQQQIDHTNLIDKDLHLQRFVISVTTIFGV